MANSNPGKLIYDGFIARGFNPAQSAALAGNMQQESSFKPTAWNAASQAGGLMQWRLDRLAGLQSYATATGRDPADSNLQMDYVVHEMTGPEAKNSAAFLKANDVAGANAALKRYVRYGDTEAGNRLQYATNIANQVRQYDAAGNPVEAQAPPTAPAQLAPAAAPAQAAPQLPAGNDDALLAKYLGGDTGSPAAPAPAQGTAAAAPSADDALLAKYLGAADAPKPDAVAAPGRAPSDIAADPMRRQSAAAPASPQPGSQSAVPFMDPVNAFANAAVDAIPIVGPTLTSWGNNVDAGINNLLGFQHETPEDRAKLNANNASSNPLMSGAGTVAGTVVPLMAGGALPGGARLLGMEGGLATRMAMGGLSGAAISGADTLARGGSATDAGQNALIGGAVGGAVPLVGKVVGAAKDAFLGPSAPKMVANALVADQNAPAQVNRLLQQTGPGATIADLGPNTQSLAAGMASLPGEPKTIVVNNLKARSADTGNRLTADVAGTIGAGQPVGALVEQLSAAQKSAADPLYAAVRDVPVQVTDDLKAVMDTPLGKRAFAKAAELAANDGKVAVPTTATLSPQEIANHVLSGTMSAADGEKLILSGGTTTTAPKLTVGLVDYAKQALDDIASAAKRSGENNDARQASGMASRLTTATDAQIPAYAHARDAFAGPAKVKDAIEMGQGIFSKNVSPEDLQSEMAAMSASEKDGLLAGAQAAVQKAIGSARTDAAGVKSLFDSDYGKEKLALLVGKPEADKIAAAIERERVYSDTSGKAYKNSISSANLAQQKVINPDLAAIPNKMPPQTAVGALFAGIEKARGFLTSKYRGAQNVKAANMLTGGPLSPKDAAAVAGSVSPRNALMAPTSVPLALKDASTPQQNMLMWAMPSDQNKLAAPDRGGPNGPLRITVPGGGNAPVPVNQIPSWEELRAMAHP